MRKAGIASRPLSGETEHISEVAKMISKKATEVHGGMGFTDLLGLHYWFKRIGLNRQILGAPEIVREEAAELQGFNQ